MPRSIRTIFAKNFYHIVSRGNNRQNLFQDPSDHLVYLEKLTAAKEKYPVSIFHYCLMSNHTHMLIQSSEESKSITRFVQSLQTSYALYFHKKNQYSGHVFENRFRHFLIQTDAYLLECGRYIERNPVRANLVNHPQDYPWSSYHHYSGSKKCPFLDTNPVYLNIGSNEKERQSLYEQYVLTRRPYEELLDGVFENNR